ncbi:MAG: hypothetical protein L0Y72_00315 [Gemmataceae bacterium]|nr:hypothetical protein [Gemmataceae bacterium]MCI0737453.1 hypothetical protein [Gemmataceae bacterium]
MSPSTIRISQISHRLLKELAKQTKQSMVDVLDKALDCYRRELFFEQLNSGYAALRADQEAWAEHSAERKLWEATNADGLDADEHWTEDGRCLDQESKS